MTIKSHKELIVWQKSMELVKEVFLLTEGFPKSETYGIIYQMRRAAVAIPSNIAEGFGRKSLKSNTQFYLIAYGSALELETQLIISKELHMEKNDGFKHCEDLLLEVSKMLNSMTSRMRKLVTDQLVTSY